MVFPSWLLQNKGMIPVLLRRLNHILHHPLKVLWICLFFGVASVLLDGSFIHLWRLNRSRQQLEARIDEGQARLKQLEFRIDEAQQPQFIERQARDQFDLVKEGDLIFVFSDDGLESAASR
ncbi:MAG: septum formation initiator family protein [Bdellovibrionaceae bacterium]|nr:septum formation initiator family protein [Pseudobdellovibrionaceae bacterium]